MRALRIGDCLEVLKTLEADSIDSCVTDPPYELGFMGKSWDSTGIAYNPDLWREVLRVLKPGAHLLSFGGTRTYHRMACAIEDAGFEIRDQIQWLYGSGFPKSLDVSKAIDKHNGDKRPVVGKRTDGVGNTAKSLHKAEGFAASRTKEFAVTSAASAASAAWEGWGTALKPANEPIVVARKPLSEDTVAANVLKWGTGALNIGASRIGSDKIRSSGSTGMDARRFAHGTRPTDYGASTEPTEHDGRWPANIILDEEAGKMLDEQSGTLKSGSRKEGVRKGMGFHGAEGDGGPAISASEGGASRFFYCAKASKKDRGEGNNHPTVKPTSLMAYLCRLVTPPNGTVLDPFMGSGSTGRGAVIGGFGFVGIEREAEYLEIAKARIGAVLP